jgi:hypothetical protein
MGLFDLIGTTASGWLTDRYDPRKLLFVYCGLRGLSLPFLDFSASSLLILPCSMGCPNSENKGRWFDPPPRYQVSCEPYQNFALAPA